MEEKELIGQAVEEIKTADEENLQKIISDWFEKTRSNGMKIGASYMSAGIYGIIQKHIKKASAPSRRDYERCINEIIALISVQLNNTEDEQSDDVEESENDGRTE